MFDYIDSSGNIITYDQINKMAKEGKTSFDAIVKKNGYKQKPNKVKSGAELLGIDTTTKKKTPIAKKTVIEDNQTSTRSFYSVDSNPTKQSKLYGEELLLSNKYKDEKAKKENINKLKIQREAEAEEKAKAEKLSIFNKKEQLQKDLNLALEATSNRPITADMVGAFDTEEEFSAFLKDPLAIYGVTPIETTGVDKNGFERINAITIGGKKGQVFENGYGYRVGSHLSEEERKLTAERLNDIIEKYGNKNFAEESKAKYGGLSNALNKKIAPPKRTPKQQNDLYTKVKPNQWAAMEEAARPSSQKGGTGFGGESVAPLNFTIAETGFQDKKDYKAYMSWVNSGRKVVPLPSEEELQKFIGIENDKARQYGFEKAMNDLEPEARVAITAIRNKELIEIKKLPETGKALEAEGIELDNNIKSIINNKNRTPAEIANAQKQILAYNKKLENFNTLVDKAPKSEKLIVAGLEASKANYNRLEQTATALKKTGVDIAGGVVELATATTDLAIVGAQLGTGRSFADLWEAKRSITKRLVLDPIYGLSRDLEKEGSSYQKGVSVGDIKDLDDLGRWAAATTTSMPSSIGMALTGELALPLFFLSGFGSKSSEIQSQQVDAVSRLQENMDALESGTLSEEQIAAVNAEIKENKRILNISEGQRLTSAAVSGIAEVVFEKFGSMQILKNTAKSLKAVSKDALYRGIRHNTKVFLKEAAKSIPREGITEGLTQLSNNLGDIYVLGDKKKSLWEGVPDATAAGAFMGPGFASMASARPITNAIVSELSSRKEMKDRAKKVKKLRDITNYEDINHDTSIDDLNKLPMSPEARRLAEEIINEFDGEKEEILNRLGKDLSIDQVKEVGDLNQKIRELAENFNATMADGSMSESQLKAAKESYEQAWKETMDARESILGNEEVRKENNKDYNTKKLQLRAQKGWGIYQRRTTANRYLEKEQAFAGMSTASKQDYYSKVNIALQEEKKSELAGEELETAARNAYVTEKLGEDLDNDIKFAEGLGKEMGLTLNFQTVETAEEMLKAAKKIKKNLTKKEIENILGGANGAQIGNTIIINKALAIQNGHTSVGSHELLHAIVASGVNKDEGVANTGGKKLLEYLKESQPDLYAIVSERMKAYEDKDGKPIVTNYGEEVLNALSDTFKDGKKPNESTLTRLSNFLNALTKGKIGSSPGSLTTESLDSMSGSNIYNLIKNYHTASGGKDSNVKSRFLYSNPIEGEEEEEKSADLKFSKSSKELKLELEDIKENEGDYDPDDFDQQVSNLEGKIKRAIEKEKSGVATVAKKEVTEEDIDKEIIKNEKGSISSDKVQKIYEEKGAEGAQDIINLFKPITRRLVNRRRDAPGFDEELLRDEIETGAGGILDLIKSYDPSKGVPLAAYINKQLPLRAIASSRRVLDKEFSKDVTEEKGLIAEEAASETKEKPKYNNALEAKVFSPEVLKTATNKIVTIVRTLKSRIDAPVTLNRTVTPLISEIRDEVGKQLDIDIKTMLGGKKDGVLKKELLRNKKYILENMTTTWLMGKDGQGGIPQAIQKQIDGKFVSFPDWVGQKIDREKTTTDQAGRTSGAELVRRLPNVNNNVSNEDFLAQIIGPDGNPIRGRKESLSKAMAEEGAFDIINADLAEEGPIFEALATNQERQGYEIASNMAVDFARQADRGNIKFLLSSSLNAKLLGKAISDLDSEDRKKLFFKGGDIEDKKLWNDYDRVKSFVDIFNKVVNEKTGNLIIYSTMAAAVKREIKDNKKYSPGFVKKAKEVISVGKVELNNKTIINITEKDKDNLSFEYLFKNDKLNQQKADAFIEMANEFVRYLPKLEKSKVFLASVTGIGYVTTGEGNRIGKYTMEDGSLLPEKYTDAWKTLVNNLGENSKRFNKSNKETDIDDRIIQINSVQTQVNRINNSKKFSTRLERIKELEKWLKSKSYIENKPIIQDFYNSLFFAQQDFLYDAENKEDYLKRLSFLGTQARLGTYLTLGARQLADLTHIEIVDKKPKGKFTANIEHVAMPHVVSSINLFRGIVNRSEQAPPINNTMSIDSKNRLALDKKTGTLSNLGALKILAMKDATLAESLISIDELSKGKIVTLKDQINDIGFSISDAIENNNTSEAITNSFKFSKSPKGISVFDFDDTVGLTKGSVLYTMPDGPKGKLNAEEFAKKGAKFLEEGAVFDFSEFSKVVDGKPGPMVEKMKKMIGKFGPENFFILTARPAEAAAPIHEFLTSIGINIPLENITGLGNSTAQAKADWMVGKVAEGYNDFYFADDASQNVEAVKKALEVPGITSKVQQARLKFSLNSRQDLNWRETGDSKFATFEVKGKEYSLFLTDTGYFNWRDRTEATLNTLINKYELDEPALLGSYEGETLNLVFSDENSSTDITGVGNAAEVFGTVINGVIDYANANNTDNFIFTAKEPSRIKLYDAIASTIANKLKWNVFSKNGVYIISKYPAGRGILPFENQSKAVQNVLNVVDVKSPRQQAKIKFSLSMSDDFNRIIEENKGVESYKVYSDITARRRGLKKNRFDFYVPPSAADFELILYKFMGKKALGEEQKQFFQDALIKPYINGVNLMDSVRQSIKKEYKALLKSFPEVKKDLEKLTPNKDFTYDQAMRVAIWNQYGTEIPGLSQRDVTYLTDLVNSDPELAAFKDGLIVMGRQKDGWLPPGTFWDSDTIISDLYNITEGAGRKKFLGEFIENTENIFGKWEDGRLVGPNINKVEAVYGTNVREALEDSIYRMINGKNRSIGQDKETSAWSSWVNGSTGAIMFMNTRSAALQMLGAVNFLNWRDNNPFNAGKAFLNQPQYWKDFSRIWNSDKLKERRGGLREDVASAEIANAAAGSKNKVVAVTSYLLKIGYTPTQLADSFAIASGGAPFYRNRVNSYLKEGLTEQEAEAKAWQDFSKVSDETQQSGDPKDISKQQSSAAGRLLLVFQNFTMQQSRIVKKAALDLKNGRGDAKTNISKIFYYLAVQNIMFSTLQQGLFAVAFDDDDDEDKDKKKKTKKDAAIDVANGVLDSILRGTGFVGGITATLKNTVIKYLEEREKKQKAEYAKVVLEVANMSPPIGSKLRKTYSALQQTKYDKDLIAERGWGVMQDGRVHLGPMYSVTGKLVEVGTNFPMDRLVNKVENVSQAFNSENTVMQRIATAAGYSPYTVGIEGTKGDILIKETAKAKRKDEGIIKAIETREATKDSIRALRGEARVNYFKQKREKAIKARERKKELLLKKRKRRMGE